MTAGRARGPH